MITVRRLYFKFILQIHCFELTTKLDFGMKARCIVLSTSLHIFQISLRS